MREDKTPWLHIRGQFTYHAEATIRATEEGLLALLDAVQTAIAEGKGVAEVFASDGEGYELIVERSSTIAGIGEPTYADAEAAALAAMEKDFLLRESKLHRAKNKEALSALSWCLANGNPHIPPSSERKAG